MKRAMLMMVLLLMTGCLPWQRTESHYVSSPLNIACDLPSGWMRQNTDTLLLITHDGTLLQRIVANRMKIDQKKQFAWTKKRITNEMLPQEAAEVILDDFQSNQNIIGSEVEENAPASIGGVPGFKTRIAYKTKEGLKYRCVYYGALSGKYFYCLFYEAPARYYFDRDVGTFETLAKTFRLLKADSK